MDSPDSQIQTAEVSDRIGVCPASSGFLAPASV
jgi:hypothetical protein